MPKIPYRYAPYIHGSGQPYLYTLISPSSIMSYVPRMISGKVQSKVAHVIYVGLARTVHIHRILPYVW